MTNQIEEDENFYFSNFTVSIPLEDGTHLYHQFIFRKSALQKLCNETSMGRHYDLYIVTPLDELIRGDVFVKLIDPQYTIQNTSRQEITDLEFYFCKKIQIKTSIKYDYIFRNELKIKSIDTEIYDQYRDYKSQLSKALRNKSPLQDIDTILSNLIGYNGYIDITPFSLSGEMYLVDLDDIAYVEDFLILLMKKFTIWCLSKETNIYIHTIRALCYLYETAKRKNVKLTVRHEVIQCFIMYDGRTVDIDEEICIQISHVKCNHENCIRKKFNLANRYAGSADSPEIFKLRHILYDGKGDNSVISVSSDNHSKFIDNIDNLDPILIHYLTLDYSDLSQLNFSIIEEKIDYRHDNFTYNGIIVQKISVYHKWGRKSKSIVLTYDILEHWHSSNFIVRDTITMPDPKQEPGKFIERLVCILTGMYKNPIRANFKNRELYEYLPQLYHLIYNTVPLKYYLPFVKSIRSEDQNEITSKYGLKPSDVFEGIADGYYLSYFSNKTGNIKRKKYLQDFTFSEHVAYMGGFDRFCKGAGDLKSKFLEALKEYGFDKEAENYCSHFESSNDLDIIIDNLRQEGQISLEIENKIREMDRQNRAIKLIQTNDRGHMWKLKYLDESLDEHMETLDSQTKTDELWQIVVRYLPEISFRDAKIIVRMIHLNFLCQQQCLSGERDKRYINLRNKTFAYLLTFFVESVRRDKIHKTFVEFPEEYIPQNEKLPER